MKRKFLLIFGVFISGFFLWLSFKNLKVLTVLHHLAEARWPLILVGVSSYLTGHLMRAVRWKIILSPTKKVRYINSLGSIFIGIFGNTVFPLRAGELWRSVAIKFREEIPLETALSSLAFERVIDGVAVITLVSGASLAAPKIPLIREGLKILGILTLSGFIAFAILFFLRSRFRPDSKLFKVFNNIVKGFQVIGRPHKGLIIIALSLAIWTAEAMSYYFILLAFGITENLSLPFIIMLGVNVGVSIPSGPGFVGTFEYAIITVLQAFGVGKELALSFAVTYHSVIYLTASSIGAFFAYLFGVKAKMVKASAESRS